MCTTSYHCVGLDAMTAEATMPSGESTEDVVQKESENRKENGSEEPVSTNKALHEPNQVCTECTN